MGAGRPLCYKTNHNKQQGMCMYDNASLSKVRVWDLPTRIFHWALVIGVIGLAISGTVGGNAMVWHFRFGYAVLTLLLFRIIWAWWVGAGRVSARLFMPRKVSSSTSGAGASPNTPSATAR